MCLFCFLCIAEFYVLLTVQPGMILVNNQLDAQDFCVSSCLFTKKRPRLCLVHKFYSENNIADLVQRVPRLRAVYLRCVLIISSYRWRYCLLRGATDSRNPAIRERTRRTSWQWLTVSTGEGTNRPAQMGRKMGRRRTRRPYTRWPDTFKRVAGQCSRSARHRSELNRYTQPSYNQFYYKLRKGKQQVAAP